MWRCLFLVAALHAGLAHAAEAPCAARPIRMVVPFAAGTAVDAMARLFAERMAAAMAATWLVENVPGAGGTIGVDKVARAAPDGCMLVFSGDAALVVGANFGVKPPYDPQRDLAPIAQLIVTPNVLMVSNDVLATTVQEFVAQARRQPGKFSYASAGNGTSQHRGGELLSAMAGLEMVHVPTSTSPLPDVIAGRAQMVFANIGALPLAREGKLRALAVSSLTRSAAAPELPTVSEAGFPGFEAVAWFGLLAPAATPPDVLQQLEAQALKALATPALSDKLAGMGAVPTGLGSAAFGKLIRDETAKWARPGRP